jgi:hypothetical protein
VQVCCLQGLAVIRPSFEAFMRSLLLCLTLIVSSQLAYAATSPVFAETQKILASEPVFFDHFGSSISIHGNTALISAYWRNHSQGAVYVYEKDSAGTWHEVQNFSVSGSTFVGEKVSLFDDFAVVSASKPFISSEPDLRGEAFLFHRDTAGVWSQVTQLQPGEDTYLLGASVSMGSNIAAVSSISINGLYNPGAVFLFSPNSSGQWVRSGKLQASDGEANDLFGIDVATSNNRILVGARSNDRKGAAYVFEQDGDLWTQTAKLTITDGQRFDYFGASVALSGDVALIGSPGSGSAFLFHEVSPGNWQQLAKLIPDETLASYHDLGYSVSLWNNFALVGTGDYGAARNSGKEAAYLFQFDRSGNWSQVAKYVASDPAYRDGFGWEVSIADGSVIIGAPGNDDFTRDDGSAYAFNVVPEPSAIFLCMPLIALIESQRRRSAARCLRIDVRGMFRPIETADWVTPARRSRYFPGCRLRDYAVLSFGRSFD